VESGNDDAGAITIEWQAAPYDWIKKPRTSPRAFLFSCHVAQFYAVAPD